MTTTVLIGTQGNKEVEIMAPTGRMVLPPGRWYTLGIHGDQTLSIKETGEFVNAAPGVRFEDAPVAPQPPADNAHVAPGCEPFTA